ADTVVVPSLRELEEPIKADHRAGGAKTIGHAVPAGNVDLRSGALNFGARGLACQSPLPDELVEPGRVVIEVARDALRGLGEVRGPDGFVRFLRVLGFRLVLARRGRHVVATIELLHRVPRGSDCVGRDLYTVG